MSAEHVKKLKGDMMQNPPAMIKLTVNKDRGIMLAYKMCFSVREM